MNQLGVMWLFIKAKFPPAAERARPAEHSGYRDEREEANEVQGKLLFSLGCSSIFYRSLGPGATRYYRGQRDDDGRRVTECLCSHESTSRAWADVNESRRVCVSRTSPAGRGLFIRRFNSEWPDPFWMGDARNRLTNEDNRPKGLNRNRRNPWGGGEDWNWWVRKRMDFGCSKWMGVLEMMRDEGVFTEGL